MYAVHHPCFGVNAMQETHGSIVPMAQEKYFSIIMAVDMCSRSVLWKSPIQRGRCQGLAVLPRQGVVVVGSFQEGLLHVLRISDGAWHCSVCAPFVSQVTADATTGNIYAITSGVGPSTVSIFKWTSGRFGVLEGLDGYLAASGKISISSPRGAIFNRPLVVVPAASGKTTAHLVVAVAGSAELQVFSLPEGRSVYRTRLSHAYSLMRIVGLAANPSGTALAICDAESGIVDVLSWPLRGMPHLP